MSGSLLGPLRSVGGASGQDARTVNRRSTLHAIASGAAVTRADIARVTGLTRPTVSSLVAELVDEGLVVERGPGASAGGKRPTLLAVDVASRQVIAIDVSSSPARGQVLDLAGEVVVEGTGRPARTGDDAVDAVAELIADLAAAATAPLVGVGVGSPGLVTADGVVVEAGNLGWHGRALRDELREVTGLPIRVANDADAASLVEFGRLPEGHDSLVLLRIGAGIGAGLVLGGRPYPGPRAAAGEVGHLVVVPDGEACTCGNRGCLETVASVRAILSGAGAEGASLRHLDDLLALGGDGAEAAIDLAALHLGTVVAHMVAALDVRDVVLSVELPGLAEVLASRAQRVVAARLLPQLRDEVAVRATASDEALVLDGAHALVLAGELGMVRP